MEQILAQHSHPRTSAETDDIYNISGDDPFVPESWRQYDQVKHDTNEVISRIDNTLEQQDEAPRAVEESTVALSGIRQANKVSKEALESAKQLNAQVLGRAALSKNVSGETQKQSDLADLFEQAAKGNEQARQETEVNSTSEVIEMVCKAGAKMTATAQMIDGKLTQFGKTTEERQYNTLTAYTNQFPAMRAMNEAEGQNAFLFEELYSKGKLKEGDKLVEISLIPKDTHQHLKGTGLFLREVILIIRETEVDESGLVNINSYLIAGTDLDALVPPEQIKTKSQQEEVERQALDNRIDIDVAREILQSAGVDNASQLSPAGISATPLILPKGLDGLDLVMQWDDIASAMIGKNVMLGGAVDRAQTQSRPTREEYIKHFEAYNRVQQKLQEVGQEVARKCANRWREVQGDPFAASRLMHELAEKEAARFLYSEKHRLDTQSKVAATKGQIATQQESVLDFTALGAATYQSIMESDLQGAMDNAEGTGCPSLTSNTASQDDLKGGELGSSISSSSQESNIPSDRFGSLQFQCSNGHWNTRKATSDPKLDFLPECKKCGEKFDNCGSSDKGGSTTKPSKNYSEEIDIMGSLKSKKQDQKLKKQSAPVKGL